MKKDGLAYLVASRIDDGPSQSLLALALPAARAEITRFFSLNATRD